MKLLEIRVKNLNSLYGEHTVDLEKALAGAPLFLIVGPTGSGKSTLLDAISLALFGQTPRLPLAKTKSDVDQDSRNVMSRGTGEALAQVVFSKREGGASVRYRAQWYCRRARGKPQGAFQDPVRSLERAEGCGEFVQLVEDSREKFFQEAFERALEGMTVDDFKRSMLLAQGEFALFLKASEEQRASILERLTDTGVYQELGATAAQRRREAQRAAEQAQAALESVQLLSDAEQASLREELEETRASLASLRRNAKELETLAAWSQRLRELEASSAHAEHELERAKAARASETLRLKRLAEHERGAPLLPTLRELERLRRESSKLAEALPALRSDAEALEQRLLEAQQSAIAESAEADAAAARARQAGPELTEARRLHLELAAALEERARATEAAHALASELRAAQQAQHGCEESAARAAKAFDDAQVALERLAPSQPLLEALAGVEARHQALQKDRSRGEERRTLCESLEAALAQGQHQLQEDEHRLSALSHRVATAEVAARAARAALLASLEGAVDAPARRRTLGAEQAALAAELQRLDGLRREREAQSRIEAQLAEAGHSLGVARDELVTRRTELGRLEGLLGERRQALDDQRWVKSMASHRARLSDGAACPLCGGTEHPHLRDPEIADFDARIDALCRKLEAELADTEARHAEATRSLAALEKAEAAYQALVDNLSGQRVALPPAAEALPAERERMKIAQRVLEQRLTILDEAERIEREAGAASAAASAAALQLRAGLEALRARMAEQSTRLADERTVRDREHARTAAQEQVLLEELSSAGVDTARDLAAAVEGARQSVVRLRKSQEVMLQTAQERQVHEAALEAARAAVSAAQTAWQRVEAERAARTHHVEVLTPAAAAALGGRNPEDVERELTGASEEALRSARSALAHAQRGQEQLARTQTLLTEKLVHGAELALHLSEAEAVLAAQLRPLELGSEQALRAQLLPEDEALVLAGLRSKLEREEDSARRVAEERTGDLELHRALRPKVRGEWSGWGLAELASERMQVEAAQDAALGREHALSSMRARDEEARSVHARKQELLLAARDELDTWERLHRLIGVNEGSAFKLYAQTLNLADLIARANQHLQRLAPRYSLVGARTSEGAARIAFAIQDAFQADEVRPVNTLSGGETFLVSLSLALGLAGYRQVKMPIETLLLDEGFGTLDPHTLQVAMSALEVLHASGTQVGIISHMEALKERIPSRVLVERDGAGRSMIRLETS